MNATEYFQKRHKWAQALRVRDVDVPAEVVFMFFDSNQPFSEDEMRSARRMVKNLYTER